MGHPSRVGGLFPHFCQSNNLQIEITASHKARLTLDAMEGDSERTKISYFHHWINGEGMGHIESWKNSKTLIHPSAHEELDEDEKEGKYSSESIESYFTLFKLLLAPNSNPLLAVEELHFAKQGSDIQRFSLPYC